MNEDDTYNKLRRTPVDEMLEILKGEKWGQPPPVMTLGDSVFEQNSQYRALMRLHCYKAALLANGWDYEEFMVEVERKNIVDIIDKYNESIKFPEAIIENAKKFFPNLKFTPARIELE